MQNFNTAERQDAPQREPQGFDPVYSYIENDGEETPRRRRTMRLGMAVIIAGGLLGLLLFSYKKGQEAGSEASIAVIEPETPYTRIKPQDPQGLNVPDQDKLVYGAVDPSGVTQPEVERLTPPPEQPLINQQLRSLATAAQAPASAQDAAPLGNSNAAAPLAPPRPLLPSELEASVETPKEASASYTTGVPDSAPVIPSASKPRVNPGDAAAVAALPSGANASVPSLTAPESADTPRESVMAALPEPTAPTASLAPTTKEKSGGNSSVRIQLAAVKEQSQARKAWTDLVKKYPAVLGSANPSFETVDLPGKGRMVRLQATGWASAGAASQACGQLKASGQPCLLVTR